MMRSHSTNYTVEWRLTILYFGEHVLSGNQSIS